MTDTYNTSLGDYLSFQASKNGVSKSELEKVAEIHSIFLSPNDWNKEDLSNYDAVVEFRMHRRSYFLGLINEHIVGGTRVKLNLDKLKGDKK